ncbi:MAG TPA: LPS export ABC transporter periplasmic protein LptC [Steroidobacteraceae bacterium]|nr:LPS export ABC transporter periplasmic protein LptC [Steroidobacteraceae bacterium]
MRRTWLLLILAATLALWLWRAPSRGVVENENGEANHSAASGYVASDAELIDTNADGQPEFRLIAERVEQPWPAADVELTAPQISYAGETAWTVTAQHGVLQQAIEQVSLSGDVRVTAMRPGQPPWQIRTDTLDADMVQKRLDTHSTVAMIWGRNRLWMSGLHADIKADRLLLTSPINGEFAHR